MVAPAAYRPSSCRPWFRRRKLLRLFVEETLEEVGSKDFTMGTLWDQLPPAKCLPYTSALAEWEFLMHGVGEWWVYFWWSAWADGGSWLSDPRRPLPRLACPPVVIAGPWLKAQKALRLSGAWVRNNYAPPPNPEPTTGYVLLPVSEPREPKDHAPHARPARHGRRRRGMLAGRDQASLVSEGHDADTCFAGAH